MSDFGTGAVLTGGENRAGGGLPRVDPSRGVGCDIWLEMQLWQRWNEAGGHPEDFRAWLDRRDANLGGFTRRALLYRGMRSDVLAVLLFT